MSVKVNNKDIADAKVGDNPISSIYAGDVLIWESGYPNFYGKINWESSPFFIQEYRGYLVNKVDYNFKLEGKNTIYSLSAVRSDVILAVYELVINAIYLDINYDNGSYGLACFTNLEKVTFTSPFRKQNLNLYYSFYLRNCKEINGLDFGKSVITNCVGAFSQLNLINNDWSFLTTAFFRPTSCQYAFDHSNIENIDMTETWDMTDCTSLYFAFSDCVSLTTIKGLKLSEKCTSFHHAFFACGNLVSLLDTKWHGKINSGQSMFFNCSALVDAGDFSDVTFVNSDCSYMFIGCSSLTSPITLKGSISNCSSMFSGCSNLSDIDLSNVDFSNCTNMAGMFSNCRLNTDFEFIPNAALIESCSVMFESALGSAQSLIAPKIIDFRDCTFKVGISFNRMFRHKDVQNIYMGKCKPGDVSLMFYQARYGFIDLSEMDTSIITAFTLFTDASGFTNGVRVGTGYFNTNVATIPCTFIGDNYDNVKIMLESLIHHAKTSDEDWQYTQTVSLSRVTWNAIQDNETLSALFEEACDAGWEISHVQ